MENDNKKTPLYHKSFTDWMREVNAHVPKGEAGLQIGAGEFFDAQCSCGQLFICFGTHSRICIGVLFFENDSLVTTIFDKILMTKAIRNFAPKTISPTETIYQYSNKKAFEIITKQYFDGYLFANMNGLLRLEKTRRHGKIKGQLDYKQFANVLFGKINPTDSLIEVSHEKPNEK